MKKLFQLFFLVSWCWLSQAAKLDQVFSWKQLEFQWPNPETKNNYVASGDYVPDNNLPLGLAQWKNKLFVTVPRWKNGVASSLNYIPLNTANKSAALIPYPSLSANTLPKSGDKLQQDRIISTFRISVDKCDRLWVMDTGLADILGNSVQHSTPALVIFDLNTDRLVKRYEFKPTDLKESSFFANVVVDVQPDNCEDAFAYVPDLGGYGLVVYSLKNDDSWRIKHNFFHFDPLNGDFSVGGVNFQWTDGIFGLALGKPRQDGSRQVYFHALASTHEFSVSSEVLKNQTLATDSRSYYLFKIEGDKGNQTQTSASDLDEQTGVLFMTQLNKDGIACWNTNHPLNSRTVELVAQDKEALIFTNDLKLGEDRQLWVLSDRMPAFLFAELNPDEYNYRIFKVKVDDAIAGTACAQGASADAVPGPK